MRLYMQQKVFSIGDRFRVWDENGQDRWFVEQELFNWGKTLRVYDAAGNEAAVVKRQVLTFRPRFTVSIGGREAAEIVKRFTLFYQRYEVQGPQWTVEGSFWSHEFSAYAGERCVVSIRKEWLSWGDCYTIDIADSGDELLALSVVLAIDAVLEESQNAAH